MTDRIRTDTSPATVEGQQMKAEDLEAWRAKQGYSVRQACKVLDISQNRYQRFMAGMKIPEHIGLACSAISYGLPPWHNPETPASN